MKHRMKSARPARLLFLPLLVALVTSHAFAEPSVVKLTQEDGKHRLLRNGKPYFIKGVGGKDHLEALAEAGGNSIRTWGTDNIGPLLDKAHGLGLSVMVGIWLGHERHGFNYQDGDAVSAQLEKAKAAVEKYRSHPAVLMWGIGNEMEGDGNNPAIWYAVNHIARIVKELDPNHPTATVIAELGGKKIENIHRFCPSIDIVGINTYGGVESAGKRYLELDGSKPYVLTEYGPPGQWEMGKTKWGAPQEMTSTRKAKWYYDGYQQGVLGHPGVCLGSYAFIWGHKQEATATWFGMWLKDGSRLGVIEKMTKAWGGRPPANRCPEINELQLDRPSGLKPGETFSAKLTATDPDNDPLTVKWILRQESGLYAGGGDAQPDQPEFPDHILEGNLQSAKIRVPKSGGGYRLFAYVYDGKGNAAVANQPIQVEGKFKPPAASFPVSIYSEGDAGPYVPSGYMGNTKFVKMNMNCSISPRSGKTCIEANYTASDNWAGVVWQSPANDWGQQPGGLNLTGASHLEFWARGSKGGEVVSFELGLLAKDSKFPDSGNVKLEKVKLESEWKPYRIPLNGIDLSCIKTGFAWVLAGQGAPIKFYIDDVRYVAE